MASLKVIRGNDFIKRFTWKNNGTPINMTGYTIEFIVTANGITTTYTTTPQVTLTPLSGQIDILIEDAVTATWRGDGRYELIVTSSTDVVTTLVGGPLRVVRIP